MSSKNEIKIDNKFVQTLERAEQLVDSLLTEYALPRQIIEVTTIGDWTAELWDTVTILNFAQLGIVAPTTFQVIKIQYTYDGGLKVVYTLRKTRA